MKKFFIFNTVCLMISSGFNLYSMNNSLQNHYTSTFKQTIEQNNYRTRVEIEESQSFSKVFSQPIVTEQLHIWDFLTYSLRQADNQTALSILENCSDSMLNIQDQNGYTPLHLAAYFSCPWLAEYLFSRNVNDMLINNQGYMPIHIAAYKGCFDTLKILVEEGTVPIDIKTQPTQLNTAQVTSLYISLRYKQANAQWLIEQGASKDSELVIDNKRVAMLDYLRLKVSPDILSFISNISIDLNK